MPGFETLEHFWVIIDLGLQEQTNGEVVDLSGQHRWIFFFDEALVNRCSYGPGQILDGAVHHLLHLQADIFILRA